MKRVEMWNEIMKENTKKKVKSYGNVLTLIQII